MRIQPLLRTIVGLAALLPTLGLTACAGKRDSVSGNTITVAGNVTYRPRIALPPDAAIHVRLDDANRQDTAAAPLAEQTITTHGRQVPVAFELQLADSLLSPSGRYVLRAEIRGDGGLLLWTNGASYVLPQSTSSQQNIELMVAQYEGSDTTAPATTASGKPIGAIVGPEWHLARMERIAGRNVPLAPGEAYTISFDEQGRYNGQAHCNRYGGEYQLKTSGALALMQGLSTLAACAPPSSADAYLRILHAATSLTHSADTMRLTSPAGGLLVFTRQAK